MFFYININNNYIIFLIVSKFFSKAYNIFIKKYNEYFCPNTTFKNILKDNFKIIDINIYLENIN